MKKRLVLSLAVLFLLFLTGAGLTMLYTYRTTKDLESVINLHRIEIIRQNFVINVQTVQSNLYATGTVFGKEMDAVVDNVTAMDESIHSCKGCHHNKEMTERLNNVYNMVQQYKEAISYLVTSTANEERIERLKSVAVGIGDALLGGTLEMALIADRSLSDRTIAAVKAINNSRIILVVTLILSFVIALGIAVTLTRQITKPVLELVNAARMIASGRLGYKTEYKDKSEFGEVAQSFNAMSTALQCEREKTDHYIEQLSGLYRVTVSLYSIAEMQDAFREICGNIARILRVRQCILLLFNHSEGVFLPAVSVHELTENTRNSLCFTREKMEALYRDCEGMPIMRNEVREAEPFAPEGTDGPQEKDFLVSWLFRNDKILGALRVSDKEGGFTEEDSKIMIILANHMAVAMENAELYQDLQDKMSELRETQEQLIQSAKLAAIGELASNVAHEINNPLTTIIGFTELSKEDEDMDSIRTSLEIIEQESLRARDIVSQLLNFARKKPLQLTAVNINSVLKDVVVLTKSQARMSKVSIREDYGEFPVSTGDADQLKQVFLNIVNNAICAMPQGGTLTISTSQSGELTVIRIADTGPGISKDIMNRIFEPFFTTKKDKGTGLGLSISYRIIQDHGGKIDVESSEGAGTAFIVKLPHKLPASTL